MTSTAFRRSLLPTLQELSKLSADFYDGDAATFGRLLAEARCGSNKALGSLFQSHGNYLLWLANRELANDFQGKGGASDLVQQTFLRAQEGFDGFRGQSPEQLQGWLRRILLRTVANFHREHLAEKREAVKETSLDGVGTFERNQVAIDGTSSPSSMLRHDEEEDLLVEAIDELPEDYRQVLQLRYWDQMKFSDIGLKMNRSAEAARKLWARALAQLERRLESCSDDG